MSRQVNSLIGFEKKKKEKRKEIVARFKLQNGVTLLRQATFPRRRRFNAAEMDALRRSARISKLDRKTNEYIREKMDAPDTILDEITRKKQLIWYGHVDRMDPTLLPKTMINWKPEGRKKRGRHRRTWKYGIYTAVNERDLRMGEWNNRRQWNMEVGWRRQTFYNRTYIYIYIYIYTTFLTRHRSFVNKNTNNHRNKLAVTTQSAQCFACCSRSGDAHDIRPAIAWVSCTECHLGTCPVL
jgi:hypothetical protein